MPSRETLEATFVEHLPAIERVVSISCRRHGIAPSDVAEVQSWVRLKFVESDYAPIAKFRGESSLATYLAVVTASYVRDWRIQHRGKWRPSVAARSKGDLAVRLERLIHRDGRPLQEAGEHLRTSGETNLSDRALAELLATLPSRPPLRPIDEGEGALAIAASTATADNYIDAADDAAARATVGSVLSSALEQLPPEDRLVVRLRFWEGATVADISRTLGVLQKPLYRQLERALKLIKSRLEASGVSARDAQQLLDERIL
jgi:RNA polymerase sigma factor (sigma-70 family)